MSWEREIRSDIAWAGPEFTIYVQCRHHHHPSAVLARNVYNEMNRAGWSARWHPPCRPARTRWPGRQALGWASERDGPGGRRALRWEAPCRVISLRKQDEHGGVAGGRCPRGGPPRPGPRAQRRGGPAVPRRAARRPDRIPCSAPGPIPGVHGPVAPWGCRQCKCNITSPCVRHPAPPLRLL